MKTIELTGEALNWAVSVAHKDGGLAPVAYSTDWVHGGPIIEQERMTLSSSYCGTEWYAVHDEKELEVHGPTPLVAAMRCYVDAKLGEDVDVPEELLK